MRGEHRRTSEKQDRVSGNQGETKEKVGPVATDRTQSLKEQPPSAAPQARTQQYIRGSDTRAAGRKAAG